MAATTVAQTDAPPLVDLNEPAGQTAAAIVTSQTISADEVALYDRQIRLWGMEAQTRMRNAKVLIIRMRALANEVAKNLVLAGVGSLTVLDDENVVEDDLGAQFFVSEGHVGQNRAEAAAPAAQRLNPRVPVHVDTTAVEKKSVDYYKNFDIVIATDLDSRAMISINEATRAANVPFYAAASYGLHGFIFADLINHTFVIKRVKSNRPTELKSESRTRKVIATRETREGDTFWEFVSKEEVYVPLSEAVKSEIDKTWRPRKRRNVPAVLPAIKALWAFQEKNRRLPDTAKKEDIVEFTEDITQATEDLGLPAEIVGAPFIRSFMDNAASELSPVAAVLGGLLAQDVINVLAKLEHPIQNILVFDGDASGAPILVLAPQED